MSSQLNQIDLERKLERIDEKLNSISVDQIDQITSIQNELNQLTIDCHNIAVSIKFMDLFSQVSSKVAEMLRNSWTIFKKPEADKVLSEIQKKYNKNDAIDFVVFGSKVSDLFAIPPTADFFISAVQQSPDSSDKKAPRQQTRRSTRSSQAEVTRPLQVLEQEKRGGDKYVSRLSKKLTKECQKTHEARFINALTDKKSFSKTVEQLFDAAVLVKNNHFGLAPDKDNIPVFKMNQISEQEDWTVNHAILSINSKAYKKLARLSGIEDDIDDNWEKNWLLSLLSFGQPTMANTTQQKKLEVNENSRKFII